MQSLVIPHPVVVKGVTLMSAVPSAIELAKDIDKAALAPISDFAIDKGMKGW